MYVCMYEFFIQDSPFSSYWTVINGGPAWEGPRVFKVPIWTTEANFIATAQLDNHPSGLSVTLSSWVLSWVERLPFFKSLVWPGQGLNPRPSVLEVSTLPLHYQPVVTLFIVKNILEHIIFFMNKEFTFDPFYVHLTFFS